MKKNELFDKYQIWTDLNENNFDRELNNFVLTEKYLKKGNNVILTFGEKKEILYKDTKINQKNIIKFLLDLK